MEFLNDGAYLVVVDGGTISSTPIDPDFPELDAALYYVKEAMTKAMLKKAEARPKSVRMSDKEIEAWEAYEKIIGDDKPKYLEYPSMSEIANAGCDVIKERAKSEKKKFRAKPKTKVNSILDLEI